MEISAYTDFIKMENSMDDFKTDFNKMENSMDDSKTDFSKMDNSMDNSMDDFKTDFSKINNSMDDCFFSDSPRKRCRSSKINATDGEVICQRVPFKSGMIVLMKHPASFTIKRHLQIKVLLGSVSVFGYEIGPQNNPLKVFSTKNTGLIKIKTKECANLWSKKRSIREFRTKVDNITEHKVRTQNIMEKLTDATSVIFIKLCPYPTNLQLLELYFPHVFQSSGKPSKTIREVCTESECSPIQFGLDVENLAFDIWKKVEHAKATGVDAPRIVVFGPKNTGKSTLICYLMNRIVSDFLSVHYLDTDPGQPEFTPPGVVSLHKVNKAVIGPAFSHQRDPISMVYTGDITVSSPYLYARSVSRLMQLYNKNYRDEPLFVNTMGWMQGMGLECLKDAMTIVNATIVVELVNEDDSSMFDYRDYASRDTLYYQIPTSCSEKNSVFSATEMREFSIISYLGKALSPYLGAVPVNKIRPCCVSWDKIAVYIFNQKIEPCRMFEAISPGIVALCTVPESAILVSRSPESAITLEDEPENECLGFGLVTAVNEKAHLIYIVTPLEMYELKRVNAIMKGNIKVPNTLIFNQDIERTPLPFVRDMEPYSDEEETTGGSMEISEETCGPKEIKYDSLKCYRKAIPRRHNRRLLKCK